MAVSLSRGIAGEGLMVEKSRLVGKLIASHW